MKREKLELIETVVMGAAATVAVVILIVVISAMFAGCAVNPDTGATELFGTFEISDATLDVAEAAADEAASAGGIVGVLGVLAGTAIAVYRRKKKPTKEETANERE